MIAGRRDRGYTADVAALSSHKRSQFFVVFRLRPSIILSQKECFLFLLPGVGVSGLQCGQSFRFNLV